MSEDNKDNNVVGLFGVIPDNIEEDTKETEVNTRLEEALSNMLEEVRAGNVRSFYGFVYKEDGSCYNYIIPEEEDPSTVIGSFEILKTVYLNSCTMI